MAYGDKRDYPKIDIMVKGRYVCSTTWVKTCREAKERFLECRPKEGLTPKDVLCRFDRGRP